MKRVSMLVIGVTFCIMIFSGCSVEKTFCGEYEVDFTGIEVPVSVDFILPGSLEKNAIDIERILESNGFTVLYNSQAEIITTEYRNLYFDEKLYGTGLIQYQRYDDRVIYGRFVILLESQGGNTACSMFGFLSGSNGLNQVAESIDAPFHPHYPFVQKYAQIIQGKEICPCKALVGKCGDK